MSALDKLTTELIVKEYLSLISQRTKISLDEVSRIYSSSAFVEFKDPELVFGRINVEQISIEEFSERCLVPLVRHRFKGHALITGFAKFCTKEKHYYDFYLDRGDFIRIELNSLSSEIMDKHTANRIEFLINKYNTNVPVFMSDDCKHGFCESDQCEHFSSCYNPAKTQNKESTMKMIRIVDQDPKGMVEHHLYFVMVDEDGKQQTFRELFIDGDSHNTVIENLRTIADNIEQEYCGQISDARDL